MAKTWYPVIDYLECAECGACVKKCSYGVYDKTKAPSPLVVKPENCVDHCHGCGNLCPNGAITYVGDDTGWTPSHGMKTAEEPCCECGSKTTQKVSVRRKQ
jgi:NAD-dependent dihydropyrimidine dehydrogenase PreA subunit